MNAIEMSGMVLSLLGGLVACGNWVNAVRSQFSGQFHSAVPLLGAVLLGTGLYMMPATRPYAWCAVALDYGTLEVLLALPKVAGELWSTSRFNQLCEYRGAAGCKQIRLHLFRRGLFTLRLDLQRAPGQPGLISAGAIGAWQRVGTRLTLRNRDGEQAVFTILGAAPGETVRQISGFRHWETTSELSLQGIELAQIRKTAD